jgi:hypothetical protein
MAIRRETRGVSMAFGQKTNTCDAYLGRCPRCASPISAFCQRPYSLPAERPGSRRWQPRPPTDSGRHMRRLFRANRIEIGRELMYTAVHVPLRDTREAGIPHGHRLRTPHQREICRQKSRFATKLAPRSAKRRETRGEPTSAETPGLRRGLHPGLCQHLTSNI